MDLTPRQKEAWDTPRHRINIYDGAVRAGKTVVSWMDWLRFIRTGPPGPLLMVGKTERTLQANILEPMLDFLGPRRMAYSVGTGVATITGRRVHLVGANDERAEQKIRGRTLVGAYGDELTLWPESFWKMLLSRLSLPGAAVIGTTNPDSPRHWLKVDTIDRADELNEAHPAGLGLIRHHFTLYDNTHLPPEFIASLEAEYVGLWHKRFVQGLWVLAEGAIYDFFDPADPLYVVDELPPLDEFAAWWVAVDYGTSNPFVALLMGRHKSGTVYVADEWRWDSSRQQRQLTDLEYDQALAYWLAGDEVSDEARRIAGALLAKPTELLAPPEEGQLRTRVKALVVDPSAASFRQQLKRSNQPGHEADNEVLDGIRTTAREMVGGRLKIHRRCKGTIDEMTAYAWDPKKQEVGEDAPLKVDDHGPDALRYGVMGSKHAAGVTTGTKAAW